MFDILNVDIFVAIIKIALRGRKTNMKKSEYNFLWGWMTIAFKAVSVIAILVICLFVYWYLKKEVTLPALLVTIGFFTIFLYFGKVITNYWLEMIVYIEINGDVVKFQKLNKKEIVVEYSSIKAITTAMNDYYIMLDGDVKLRVNRVSYTPIVIKDGNDYLGNIKEAFGGVPFSKEDDIL